MRKTVRFKFKSAGFLGVLILILISLSACRGLPQVGKLNHRSTSTSTPFRPAGTFTPTPEVQSAAALDQPLTPSPGQQTKTAVQTETAQQTETQVPGSPTQEEQTPSPGPSETSPPAVQTKTNTPTTVSAAPQPTKTTAPTAASKTNTPEPTSANQPATATHTSVPPTATSAPAGCNYSGNNTYENQVVDLINKERKNHGLAPLTSHSSLRQAARGHSQDMACRDEPPSHIGSDGSTLGSRLSAAGYSYSWAAENIAYSSSQSFSPATVVQMWMSSSGHKKNILSSKAKHIGVGFRYADDGNPGDYDAFYTADFGRP